MRVSCNGCRVLRKGCSDDCKLRPCLSWIKSSEAQANATLFLAKFYGRAGLLNLVSAGPDHLRPSVFKSLLYEACGRIVNPVHGTLGLLWSGKWEQCEAAVDAVMRGFPIVSEFSSPSLLSFDIRHVPKTADHDTVRATGRTKRPAEVNYEGLNLFNGESNLNNMGKRQRALNVNQDVGLELSLALPGASLPDSDGN